MIDEIILDIKSAEEKAEQIIGEAKENAKLLIEKAEKESADIKRKADENNKLSYKQALASIEQEVQHRIDELTFTELKKGEKEVLKITKNSSKAVDALCNYFTEKYVGN